MRVVLHGLEELNEQPPHHPLVLAQSRPQSLPPVPPLAAVVPVVKVPRFCRDSFGVETETFGLLVHCWVHYYCHTGCENAFSDVAQQAHHLKTRIDPLLFTCITL